MSPNQDDSPQPESDWLDDLLPTAAWPEPRPGWRERLQRRWSDLSPARPPTARWAPIVGVATIAAGLLLAASLWALARQRPPERPEVAPAVPPEQPRPPAPQTAEAPEPVGSGDAEADNQTPSLARGVPPHPEDRVVSSRPATTLERLVFEQVTERRRSPPGAPDVELLNAAIELRLTEPDADPDALCRPLVEARVAYERLLVEEIQRTVGPRRAAAIDLLGRVGTGRSVPVLARLAAHPQTHAPAVKALALLADSQTLAALAASEPEEGLRQHLLAALLARGDAHSMRFFLEFVRRPEHVASALAAVDRVANPPVGLLFELLDSPQQTRRSAAALVLGHVDRPEVSQRLRQMVIHNVRRREALLALAGSPQPEASQFVALAQRDPSLAALTRAAQYSLKRFFPLDSEVNPP